MVQVESLILVEILYTPMLNKTCECGNLLTHMDKLMDDGSVERVPVCNDPDCDLNNFR